MPSDLDPCLKALIDNHNRDWPGVMKFHLDLVRETLISYSHNPTDQKKEDLRNALDDALRVENIDKTMKGLNYLPSRTKSFLTT